MRIKIIVFVILMLLCINFYSFLLYTDNINYPIVIQVVSAILLLSNIEIMMKPKGCFWGGELLFLIFTYILSSISSAILYNQNFYDSAKVICDMLLAIQLYYVLKKWHISEKKILSCLIWISVVYTFLEIIQQYTYPLYLFNGRPPYEGTGLLEQRMGLWRFYIFGIDFCLLAFFAVYQNVLEKKNVSVNIIFVLFLFIGIVFFVARKSIYATISCVIIGLIIYRNNSRNTITTKVLMMMFIALVFSVLPSYLEELNEQTVYSLENSENFIRVIAADYFINKFNDSFLYVLCGAGMAGGSSDLQIQLNYLIQMYGIYQEDCGFVGYYSKFGLIGLVAMLWIVFKIIKNYKYIDLYLLLYLILRVEISFFDFWGNSLRNMAAFIIYLYLVEISIKKNKIRKYGKKHVGNNALVTISSIKWR